MSTSASSVVATAMAVGLIAAATQGSETPHSSGPSNVVIAGMVFPAIKDPVDFEDLVSLPTLKPGDAELRDRLAAGILKWETVRDHRREKVVVWNECGARIKQEDVQDVALEWANELIRAANKSEEIYGWRINLWGVMGTIANESSFDRCAIGKHTREWAYKHGLLKAKRFTWISHTKKDVIRLVKNPKWKKTWKWVDAGALQVLWQRVYRGPLENMLTLDPGLDIGIQEMQRRSNHVEHFNVRFSKRMGKARLSRLARRSWRLWPGKSLEATRSTEYDAKITKYARRMGALRTEI